MARKSIKIFLSISIIFYILVAFYIWASFNSVRSLKFKEVNELSKYINTQVNSAYSIDQSFSTDNFINRIDDIFSKYSNFAGLAVDSDNKTLEYIKFRDSSYLAKNSSALIKSGMIPKIISPHPFVWIINSNIFSSNGLSYHVTLVYDYFDRSSIFPILRNALIFILTYIAIGLIIYFTVLPAKGEGTSPAESVYNKTAQDKDDNSDNDTDEIEASSSSHTTVFQQTSAPTQTPEQDLSSVSESDSKHTRGLYSNRSGLVWEDFLSEKLAAELKRAAAFDQDSCLVFLKIKSPSGTIPYKAVSELLIEHFQYKDLAFEAGNDSFCIIIPEKDLDEGQVEVEKFVKTLTDTFQDSNYLIYAGMTSRNSRLLEEDRMIKEARTALLKAEDESVSTTIAFRTDLNKYREYIASKA